MQSKLRQYAKVLASYEIIYLFGYQSIIIRNHAAMPLMFSPQQANVYAFSI